MVISILTNIRGHHWLNMEGIDYTTFFTFNISILNVFGFWKQDTNYRHKKSYTFYKIISSSFWISFILTQFMYLYTNLHNFEELLSTSYFTIPLFVCSYAFSSLYRKIDEIKLLFKKFNEPIFQPKCEEHLQLSASTKRSYTKYSHFLIYLGMQTIVLYIIAPFWQEGRVVPTRAWFPFDWKRSPNYELVWIYQSITLIIIMNVLACLPAFSTGLLMMIGLQCDFLNITLNNLQRFHDNDKENADVMMTNLIVCIRHYVQIKKIAEETKDIVNVQMFVQFLGGAAMISTILFTLSTANIDIWNTNKVSPVDTECYFIVVTLVNSLADSSFVIMKSKVKMGSPLSIMLASLSSCILIMLFGYCWIGNKIIEKSSDVFITMYNTPWIDCDLRFQKVLLQFMTMTKSPIQITVGGVISISNATFMSIVKSSYSVFSLLHNTNN
ncbi:odorant receptor Or2-like [Diorhabda sublineata]|uniref:odorant receptor Or2-like n=1 Tax=Diorhabda sublineata TaxID=1163346 RepID=UPI0024E18D8E|nr:odorant receptor Or2-like [Diorhabda sublineata]